MPQPKKTPSEQDGVFFYPSRRLGISSRRSRAYHQPFGLYLIAHRRVSTHGSIIDHTSCYGMGWASLLTVGLVHTGLAYCLYFTALGSVSGQKAAILSYVDSLVAVLISVTVPGEPLTLWQAVGGVLILGFTLWNELPAKKK